MSETNLPPCGIYRTTVASLDGIKAERLVYFHNHGNPGPGVYYPSGWQDNRARFDSRGIVIPSDEYASSLEALPSEGFYSVRSKFHCCDKECREFLPNDLVQLGYNSKAVPILFIPGFRDGEFHLPETGFPVDLERIKEHLQSLRTGNFDNSESD
ncbi:MAG: hypothetical protein VX405_12120 [Myxococcota bacterium]|jgi:hypothetical protein|nr:hypothetical protein [Myxococcales bacterium]MBF93853.1 hypothetical protein [Myxococcales bacterium]MEC7752238.1 hypothetical protein [Myxococcota bacterium]HBU47777.1 hypothetical protein [Myxococcales bacterium]|tara:strand:+ start:982 stop:1446 length:465 start_codon:yes stop_codon:yes gene_type:complete